MDVASYTTAGCAPGIVATAASRTPELSACARQGLTIAASVLLRLVADCSPLVRMGGTGFRAPMASACRGRCTTPCVTPWPGC
eukprot:scaffold49430_cov31-Phaeocystis_antarctica.AAC.2